MSEEILRGSLYVVSTPIGNLSDITRRAVRVLEAADMIAAEDTRTTRFLLQHLDIQRPIVSYHSHNERRRSRDIADRLRKGGVVALVTDAGTPGISDPAWAAIRAAIDEGFRVIPVPGASALLAALVGCGLSTERFVFEGFLPVKKGRETRLQCLAAEERTIVLYEGPHRLERTLADLLRHLGDRPAALARELTKRFEEFSRGRLSELLEALRQTPPRGEYVVVVAGAAERRPAKKESSHTANRSPS
jgi:16S rRNA (cytidine1402-2'-O)-methyltransferase